MANYAIGLIAHGGAGKTSLAEAMLYRAGSVKKMGSIEEGTTTLDTEPEEKSRKSSTQSSVGFMEWNGHTIDLIDTPGSMNFVGSAIGAVRVIDGAVMLAGAEPGLQSQTDQLWEFLQEYQTPRLMVINRMDREQANFFNRLDALNNEVGNIFVPLQLPWGEGEGFKGIVDLVEMKAYDYGNPDKPKVVEVPQEFAERVAEYRVKLVESAAEGDDELLEKYLETEQLEPDEVRRGLVAAVQACQIVPVLCASATMNIGTDLVLNAVVAYLPDAEARKGQRRASESPPEGFSADTAENSEFAALVFKTKLDHYAGKLSVIRVLSGELHPADEIFNFGANKSERPAHLFKMLGKDHKEVDTLKAGDVGALPKLSSALTGHTLCSPKHKVQFAPISFPDPVLTYALISSGKGDDEKMSLALHRMIEEDPTLSYGHQGETGDFLVSGMGQIHLDLVLERFKREYGITAEYVLPHVPYRETIRSSSKAQGKYKKQTGGRGQYGDCWLEIKPNGQAEDLEFHSAIVGGSIPRNFIPAIEKGISESMQKGIVAGFRVIGIDVTVYDGSFHDVDSSEMAFKIAGSMAFKKAMEAAKPVLLEPIMEVEVIVNPDHMGDVMGDINSRRGRVLGMDNKGNKSVVRAEIPMAEGLTYAIDLRAMTSGQGRFTQKFTRYQDVPAAISGKVIQAARKEAEK